MPRISIVIPTFNQAGLLRRAVESVWAQTFKDTETLIVDDGSEDDTSAVARQLSTCRYIKIAHSGLPAVARNVGVKQATGDYIAFLDADDEWLPNKLEIQAKILNDDRAIGVVCSNAFIENAKATEEQLYLRPNQGKTGKVFPDLLRDNFIITSTVVMRRDLFQWAGGFSETKELRALEDYDLWLRVATWTTINYISEPLAFYQQNTAGLSKSIKTSEHWRSLEYLFEKTHYALSGYAINPWNPIIDARLTGARRARCNAHLAAGEYREFFKTSFAFFKKQPVQALKCVVLRIVDKS